MKTMTKISSTLCGLKSALPFIAAVILTTHSARSQQNLANGVNTGGTARPVQAAVYGGGYVYDPNVGSCSSHWQLAGTLCDSAPTTDSPDISSKVNTHSGATFQSGGGYYYDWETDDYIYSPSAGTGVLVVDLGLVKTFSTAAVFQMFSDGKTTHFRISAHPDTGATPPDWTNPSWTPLNGFDLIGPGTYHSGNPNMVSDPTFITLPTTSSRYVRVEMRNDGRYGSGSWTELRSFKLFGALNAPPTVSCPAPVTVSCTSPSGDTRTVAINVADADNDALRVTWTVNGIALAPHLLAAGATSDSLVSHPFGFGLNTVSVSVTDGKSDAVTCDTTVTVTAHEAPVPSLSSLPTITGECSASITATPTATDPCAEGGIVTGVSSLGSLPLHFTAQGTYTVTWTYTSPHDGLLSSTQDQTVIVKDITPPTITCPSDVSVAFGSVPAAATNPAGFLAQGGTITDNCDPNGTISSLDAVRGYCPTVVTRSYVVTDAAGNASSCDQIITVNNLFAEDGILWLQPLARNGMSSDTDPGAGGTLKYRFKLGSTIPIKVHAQGCDGNVSANANVGGKVVVFGDTDMDGVVDANEGELLIDYNGVGEAGGVMDKVDGKLQFNLDTKKLIQTFKCYILQVTVTDSSTGESRTEIVPLQAK
jgi:hypothetical protein